MYFFHIFTKKNFAIPPQYFLPYNLNDKIIVVAIPFKKFMKNIMIGMTKWSNS